MTSSRATYTALTPEYADFAIPHTPVGPRSGLSISQAHDAEFDSHDVLSGGRKDGCVQRWLARARDTARNNTGLLLVASSQAFFSLMNVAVKKLNGIDPPVPTLEVRTLPRFPMGHFLRIRKYSSSLCAWYVLNCVWCFGEPNGNAGHNICVLNDIYVCGSTLVDLIESSCIECRLWTGIPDPFLGPKGVRLLLAFRGFIGSVVYACIYIASVFADLYNLSFFGLFGVYYSLEYLSLSDATVLTFLAPMCTTVTGSFFLGEKFTRREALAGRAFCFYVAACCFLIVSQSSALSGSC